MQVWRESAKRLYDHDVIQNLELWILQIAALVSMRILFLIVISTIPSSWTAARCSSCFHNKIWVFRVSNCLLPFTICVIEQLKDLKRNNVFRICVYKQTEAVRLKQNRATQYGDHCYTGPMAITWYPHFCLSSKVARICCTEYIINTVTIMFSKSS